MWHVFQCRILLERSGFGLNELLGLRPRRRQAERVTDATVGLDLNDVVTGIGQVELSLLPGGAAIQYFWLREECGAD